jgi:hypothetical protein
MFSGLMQPPPDPRRSHVDPATLAALPPVDPDDVRALYAELLEADDTDASSNDVAQIVDDWFVARGYPSVLYRERPRRRRP